MRMPIYSAVVLASLSAICSAQTITQTFGTGANAFTMDFVQIGNPNNIADTTGSPNPVGSVAYTYNIGKYEVSRDMIDKAIVAGALGIQMFVFSDPDRNTSNKPAAGINWYEAARFVNYLNISSGSTAAYKFDVSGNFQLWSAGDTGYTANNLFRNSLAKYFLPNNDEWYKAAFGSPSGSWYNYPTGSDTAPVSVSGGKDADTAVYGQSIIADIDNAGGLSSFGTMAQGGNLREWIETSWDLVNDSPTENRTIRGGPWYNSVDALSSAQRFSENPDLEESRNGFRVAMIPEPSSLSLLALGGVVEALRRRR